MKQLFFTIIIIISLSNCSEEKKVIFYNLELVVDTSFIYSNKNDSISANDYLSFVNYHYSDSCNYFLVPEVVIGRIDYSRREIIKLPLTTLNSFRKSMSMVSHDNIKEDFDSNIKNIVFPKLTFTDKIGKGITEDSNYNFILGFEKHLYNHRSFKIDSIKALIAKRICLNKNQNKFRIKIENTTKKISLNKSEPIDLTDIKIKKNSKSENSKGKTKKNDYIKNSPVQISNDNNNILEDIDFIKVKSKEVFILYNKVLVHYHSIMDKDEVSKVELEKYFNIVHKKTIAKLENDQILTINELSYFLNDLKFLIKKYNIQ